MESSIRVTEDDPGLATFIFPNGCRIVVGVTTTELAIEVQDEGGKPLDKKKIVPLVLLT